MDSRAKQATVKFPRHNILRSGSDPYSRGFLGAT